MSRQEGTDETIEPTNSSNNPPSNNTNELLPAAQQSNVRHQHISKLGPHHHPQRPILPYAPARRFTATSHDPGRPKTHHFPGCHSDFAKHLSFRHTHHPLAVVLQHPPIEGFDLSSTPDVELTLDVNVRIGDGLHPQLLTVHVHPPFKLPSTAGPKILAKFLDPLFWDWQQDSGVHPFKATQSQYAHEAQTLTHFRDTGLYGVWTPHYYASFTANVPYEADREVTEPGTRPVQVLLKEFVEGTVFDELDVTRYDKTQKQAMLAALIEADEAVRRCGVELGDFAPGNAVLEGWKGERPKVRWIDLGLAWTRKHDGRSLYDRWRWRKRDHPLGHFDFLAEGWEDEYDDWVKMRYGLG